MADTEDTHLEDGGIEVEIAQPETGGKEAATEAQKIDAQPQPAPHSTGVEELKTQIKSLQDREAAALRERAHFEKMARDQAEEVARAQDEAARARVEAVDFRRTNLDSAIAAAAAEADVARRDYQVALETGDFAKASDANWRVNKAASQVNLLEEKKAVFAAEANAGRPHEGAVRAPQRPQAQPQNTVDAYIADKSPRTQAWLRQHPETITDSRLNNKTVAAHYDAIAEGFAPDTESYFTFIDRKLGFAGRMDEPEALEPVEQPRQRQKAAPAAPVSREAPRSERGPSRMYLTRGEQEVAEALGISPSEYARRKQAMEKQGFYHS